MDLKWIDDVWNWVQITYLNDLQLASADFLRFEFAYLNPRGYKLPESKQREDQSSGFECGT